MAVQGDYLATNNLHLRPISARLNRAFFYVETCLERGANDEKWHGHVVHMLSKVVLGVGVLVVVPISLIEAAVCLVFAAMGLAFNSCFCGSRAKFLQKISLKSLAYSLHSVAELIRSLACFARLGSLGYHTANLFLDHAIYFGSALAVHFVAGSWIDRCANREVDEEYYTGLGTNLLLDDLNLLVPDALRGLQRDFGGTVRNWAEDPTLEGFLVQYPQHREFIENFNFQSLRNPAYRQLAINHIREAIPQLMALPPEQLEQIMNQAGDGGRPVLAFFGLVPPENIEPAVV